jgi:hypothetical protein
VPCNTIRSVPLQSVRLCRFEHRGHPRCRSPRGVKVPCRVFQETRLCDSLGASSPTLTPLSHAGVRPQRTGPDFLAVRRDSNDHPLFGFRSPTGYDPLVPPHVSRRPATLLGFVPLQRISVGGVYVVSACGPIRRLRSVRRVRALSTVCSSTHLATPFDVAALVGLSLQGFPLPNRPSNLRSRVALLTLLPRLALSPPR